MDASKLIAAHNSLFQKFQGLAAKMDADMVTVKQTLEQLVADRNVIANATRRLAAKVEQLEKVVLANAKTDFTVTRIAERADAVSRPVPVAAPENKGALAAPKVVDAEAVQFVEAETDATFFDGGEEEDDA